MSDYSQFDAALLAHIAAGKNTFLQLEHQTDLKAMAEPFCNRLTPPFRIIDRRLQALRKKGQIAYSTKHGWKLVESQS